MKNFTRGFLDWYQGPMSLLSIPLIREDLLERYYLYCKRKYLKSIIDDAKDINDHIHNYLKEPRRAEKEDSTQKASYE